MSEIQIRSRQPDDLDACVAALALVYRVDEYPTNWPSDPAGWLAPAATMRAWVALASDGAVAGHVILQSAPREEDRLAYVSRLFVTPTARGGDLGSKLLEQARQWATAQGLDLALEVVDSERSHSAIALYERTGWSRVDTVRAHWTTPDGGVVMMHRYILPRRAAHT